MLNIITTKLKAAQIASSGALRSLKARRALRPASAQMGSIAR